MTIKPIEEPGKPRARKPLWLTILIFLPVIIFVAYILLVTIHGIDDFIRERAAGSLEEPGLEIPRSDDGDKKSQAQ